MENPQSERQEERETRFLTSSKHWEGSLGRRKAACGQSQPCGLDLPLWGCGWYQRKETQSHGPSRTALQDSGRGQRNWHRAWKVERGRKGLQGGKDAAPWVPDAPHPSLSILREWGPHFPAASTTRTSALDTAIREEALGLLPPHSTLSHAPPPHLLL